MWLNIWKKFFNMNWRGIELELYNEAIESIKNTNKKLINELDKLINDYKNNNLFEIKFFLDKENDKNVKIEYLKKLREKLIKMDDCDKVKIRVATKYHPMCWAYHLSKKFPKNELLKNFIMHRILRSILFWETNYVSLLCIWKRRNWS